MIALPVRHLLTDSENRLELTLLTGKKGLTKKKITIPQIQKPGLALTGDTSNLHAGRVQVFGNAEMNYLKSLNPVQLKKVIQKISHVDLACVVLSFNNKPPKPLMEAFEKRGIPLFQTPLSTSTFVIRITQYLEDCLTESTTVHGVLVDVFGIGTLLTGKSGMGKSECGLELVMKGHRLIADDMVHISKKDPHSVYGSGSQLTKYHMEIRGLGIINIKDLFGVASVRDQKMIELVIELVEWGRGETYDRLGIDEEQHDILGVPVSRLRIPVRPGRSLT